MRVARDGEDLPVGLGFLKAEESHGTADAGDEEQAAAHDRNDHQPADDGAAPTLSGRDLVNGFENRQPQAACDLS